MNLIDAIERLNHKKKNIYYPGSIDNIFKIYEDNSKDESGYKRIFIKPVKQEKNKPLKH